MELTKNQIILITIGIIILAVIYLNLNKKENLDISENKIECESNICVDKTDPDKIKIHRLYLIDNKFKSDKTLNGINNYMRKFDIYKITVDLENLLIITWSIDKIEKYKKISIFELKILKLFKNTYYDRINKLENNEMNRINKIIEDVDNGNIEVYDDSVYYWFSYSDRNIKGLEHIENEVAELYNEDFTRNNDFTSIQKKIKDKYNLDIDTSKVIYLTTEEKL